ncbi:MAG TPA: type II toxin-antitoxin system ParD family antitoxin [Bryobacteraceae bacterium]|nr:type II toxin-antitoxin system ParD family antitoxin [Bryobacteraceae bacterium]
MTVRLDPDSERLIEQQLRAGRFRSAEEVVARALETLVEKESAHSEEQGRRGAVQDMLEFAGKQGFTLGDDLEIRDLIREGHKH